MGLITKIQASKELLKVLRVLYYLFANRQLYGCWFKEKIVLAQFKQQLFNRVSN